MIQRIILSLLVPGSCFAQNVGIGINPTKARFEVNGAVGRTVAIFGGDGAGISFQQNPSAIGFNQYSTDVNRNMAPGNAWVKWLDMNTGSLAIDISPANATPGAQIYNSTRRMTIRQNGNVSINATEANSTLFVGGNNVNLPSAIFRGTQYNSMFYESPGVNFPYRHTYINAGKNGSLVLLNDILGGNLLIGGGTTKVGINTEPTDIFEVKQYGGRGLALINSNFAYWEFFVEKNLTENASDMYVYYNGGNLGNFYQGDGKYYYYSDRRVKQQIEPISTVLSGVMALRPSSYAIKYNNPGQQRSIGLIAQEVREVFPELTEQIVGDDLGYENITDIYTLNYDALGPIAIKAIQEQQEKIQKIQTQIATLRKRIAAIEKLAAPLQTANQVQLP